MKPTFRDLTLKASLVVFSLAMSSWSSSQLRSRGLASETGPRPDAPARVEADAPTLDRARTNSVESWTQYWQKELAKTNDPLFKMAIQFQIDSLAQAQIALDQHFEMPAPIDSNLFELPEPKRAESDLASEKKFMDNSNNLMKRISSQR